MKTLFKRAGLNDQPQVLALAAEQARSCQGSLEDVGSIVNTGEVPNLFSPDDLEEINSEIGR
jgi:dynein heavy chain